MGDHRADIKIKFTIHGKTYEMDSWINWFDDGTGVDYRVVDFFRASWEDAKACYDAHCEDLYAKEHAAEIEAGERRELQRLKTKYDSGEPR